LEFGTEHLISNCLQEKGSTTRVSGIGGPTLGKEAFEGFERGDTKRQLKNVDIHNSVLEKAIKQTIDVKIKVGFNEVIIDRISQIFGLIYSYLPKDDQSAIERDLLVSTIHEGGL
jgi:hypothetical protein